MTDLATMYQDLPRLSKILLYIYVGQLLIGRYIWTQLFYYMINEYTLLFRHFQLWRIVTPIVLIGPDGMKLIFAVIILFLFFSHFERGYEGKKGEFYYMIAILVVLLHLYSRAYYKPEPMSLYHFFDLAIIYLFSKQDPEAEFTLYFAIKVKSLYLPWVILVIELVISDDLMICILSYAAAHTYYFIKTVIPREYNVDPFKTPRWVERVCTGWGIWSAITTSGPQGREEVEPTDNQRGNWRPFRGQGARLGGQ